MESWYLFVNGQQVGPYTHEQLQRMSAAGELAADAMAFDQAGQQWQALAQIPALAALAPVAYFCFRNNEQLGPFTVPQLKARLSSGELAPTDLVHITASNDWQPLQFSPLWPELAPPVTQPAIAVPPAPKAPAAAAPAAAADAASRPVDKVVITPAATATTAESAAPAAKGAPAAIQFPCKDHPNRESFLICRACRSDFCEDCLVEVGGSRFCKACQAAGKADPTEAKASKFFGKLFNK